MIACSHYPNCLRTNKRSAAGAEQRASQISVSVPGFFELKDRDSGGPRLRLHARFLARGGLPTSFGGSSLWFHVPRKQTVVGSFLRFRITWREQVIDNAIADRLPRAGLVWLVVPRASKDWRLLAGLLLAHVKRLSKYGKRENCQNHRP